jgi:hypothetical protein
MASIPETHLLTPSTTPSLSFNRPSDPAFSIGNTTEELGPLGQEEQPVDTSAGNIQDEVSAEILEQLEQLIDSSINISNILESRTRKSECSLHR